jgi:hypothetical protein
MQLFWRLPARLCIARQWRRKKFVLVRAMLRPFVERVTKFRLGRAVAACLNEVPCTSAPDVDQFAESSRPSPSS